MILFGSALLIEKGEGWLTVSILLNVLDRIEIKTVE
jgi:hypothetical protein